MAHTIVTTTLRWLKSHAASMAASVAEIAMKSKRLVTVPSVAR